MNKGTLITVKNSVQAWRSTTNEEQNLWYKELAERVHAGKDLPYDSAGESRLAPMTEYKNLSAGTRLLVMRARVAAPRGYYTISGCMEVLNLDSGESLFVQKRSLGL